MAATLRTFVALALPPAQAEALAAWAVEALRDVPDLRPVPAANLHVTLVFCGAVARERVDEVVAIARDEATGVPLPRLRPERTAVLGSVVAATYAVEPDGGRLATLQAALARRLVDDGLAAAERRPWLPHVTVARARRDARPRLDGAVAAPGADLGPSGVAVYTTVPVRGGVRYDPLALIGHDANSVGGAASGPSPRGGSGG